MRSRHQRPPLEAIEDATSRGVSINVTVSFSVPQAVQAAEAIERGLKAREAAGHDTSEMGPVVTIMVGRLDDWLKHVVARDGIFIDPSALEWAGIAAMKRAYQIFQERGYRARVLAAAFRNVNQWAEFVGGDVVVSPPSSGRRSSPIPATPPASASPTPSTRTTSPSWSASRTSSAPTSPTA